MVRFGNRETLLLNKMRVEQHSSRYQSNDFLGANAGGVVIQNSPG